MPTGCRWMTERVERYVTSRNGVSENWRRQARQALLNLVLPHGRSARRAEGWFVQLGFVEPSNTRRYSGVPELSQADGSGLSHRSGSKVASTHTG
jgi:hypothetical protein